MAYTDAEFLEQIQDAKMRVITQIAEGKSVSVIDAGTLRIEAHNPDKLLERLDKLEAYYLGRTTTRTGIRQAVPA